MDRTAFASRPRPTAVLVATLLAAILGLLGLASVATAHDEIESSIPAHDAELDAPISEVTIEFGAPVGNVELALLDPDDLKIDGTVTKLTDSTARLDFAPIEDEGQYIVRYLAEENGHLIAGAIAFTYGDTGGSSGDATTWLAFGGVAAVILAVGAALSLSRSRQPSDPADTGADTSVDTSA